MKRFDQIISPMSWLVVYLGFLPLFYAIFQPSWIEFLIFFAVDYLALAITRKVEPRLFLHFFPDSSGFFPDEVSPPTNLHELEPGLRLFDAMVRFPRRRAIYVTLMNIPKAVPGALVIICYWQHEGAWQHQLLRLILLVSFVWSYFYAAVYIESHRLISAKIAAFHERYDWKLVFEKAHYPFTRWDFKIQEAVSLVSIGGFAMLLHWLVGNDRIPAGLESVQLPEYLITFASIALIVRIWYLEKLYFVGGIEALFRSMEAREPAQDGEALPLRSSTLLARFGKVFNAREAKILAYKRELATLVQYQVEESRYQAIGELTAMTLHDISAPLHVIQFLTEQIGESPDCVKDPEYRKQLSENVRKAVLLLQSLRAHLTDSASSEASAIFGVSREHTWQLLAATFQGTAIQKVEWSVDDRLLPLQLRITNADLIHVLFSLLRNSLQNLLRHQISAPQVSLTLVDLREDEAVIAIADNGTGLSPQRYQELTALSSSSRISLGEAMDLRLTRRVVERHGGRLDVMPTERGTLFHLVLPIATGRPPVEKETRFTASLPKAQRWTQN